MAREVVTFWTCDWDGGEDKECGREASVKVDGIRNLDSCLYHLNGVVKEMIYAGAGKVVITPLGKLEEKLEGKKVKSEKDKEWRERQKAGLTRPVTKKYRCLVCGKETAPQGMNRHITSHGLPASEWRKHVEEVKGSGMEESDSG